MPEFCEDCGSLMLPTKKNGKVVFICKKCKKEKECKEESHKLSSKIKGKENNIIIEDKKESIALPTVKTKCPKCGYEEAYWWQRQMRAADEPPTTFFKCKKCGHTWREY
ncbi:MAG: transcription factor S [Candidatus Aenigmatarchaeota archaeon]|nr:transcription factor S [Candidatus Aenigmarchaeota archaeon]